MHSIDTVISYCSNDFRFIDKCIEEAKLFSQKIVIAVCDHFFDGTEERRDLLEHTYARHPDCHFIEFSYLSDRLFGQLRRAMWDFITSTLISFFFWIVMKL